VKGAWMDECDLRAEEPSPRMLVDELGAGLGERAKRLFDVRALERDVMHTRAAAGEEAPHRRILARRRQELHARVADEERGRDDSLFGERVAMLHRRAEQPLVGRDRLFEVVNRDAEMMDAADPHAVDAIRGRRASVAERERADGADRLRRAGLGLDFGEKRFELGTVERLFLEQSLRDAVER